MKRVHSVFGPQTLEKFEAAAASIPLRPLVRAFESAGFRPGADPGGPQGSRREHFRRYVASIDQGDPRQRDRLGIVLGALIAEVATSKEEYLVKAAESDGFVFTDGVFRPAKAAAGSPAVTHAAGLSRIDERGEQLRLLANDSPNDAAAGATELVVSVCRTVLRLLGARAPAKTSAVSAVLNATLVSLALDVRSTRDPTNAGAKNGAGTGANVRRTLEQLVAVVGELGAVRTSGGSARRRREGRGLSPREARLAVGAAVTLARYIAETYADRAAAR